MNIESDCFFKVLIADQQLDYRSAVITDPVPTGRQIVETAGRSDPDQFIVLRQLPSGDLEELRLSEEIDLREPGAEKFIVVRSDRSFRFLLEGERQEWPAALINGLTLKRLGGKSADEFEVFLERTEAADRKVEDDELVDLSEAGVESVYFRRHSREVVIEVNENAVRIRAGEHTGREIKETAIAQGVKINIDFVLSLHEGSGGTRIIGDVDPVRVHRGQRYTAVADDDVS